MKPISHGILRWQGVTAATALLLVSGCAVHTEGLPISKDLPAKQALLVVDMQNDFVGPDAKLPVDRKQAEIMIHNANLLIGAFERRGDDIVYIVNEFSSSDGIANWFRNGAAIEGTRGAQLSERINVVGATRFSKSQSDAFSNLSFDARLRENQITEVIVVGVFADQCVLSTARGAMQRGYAVVAVSDAMAAKSDRALRSAMKKHQKHGVELLSTVELLLEMNSE